VRFGSDVMRVEAHLGPVDDAEDGSTDDRSTTLGLAVARPASPAAARKRLTVNGVPRRAATLAEWVRVVLFAPEDMLLVAGPPGLRRAMLDDLAGALTPAYSADLATYGRALAQRNSLLRAIREEQADRDQLRLWDRPFLEAGAQLVEHRLALIDALATPLAEAHREIAPDEAATTSLTLHYETNAPRADGESVLAALTRRLAETADKEIWNGATLIGPHRDDAVFTLGGRDLAAFGSRGQQRTAVLALKLAEIDLVSGRDGRPPLLLLDDVFSELDVERRSHLVRRLTALPQAFVTTTTPADLDPRLVARATAYEVVPDGGGGARLRGSVTQAAPR
jgi:DNA replication and repair protein RecF